jgi:hypothetical protein
MEQTREQIRTAYRECFHHFAPGKVVLEDLEKLSRAAKIDRDDVNPHNAIYRVAQQDLVTYIRRMIAENEPKPVEMKHGRSSRFYTDNN